MDSKQARSERISDESGNLLILGALSLIVGLLSGLIGTAFRLVLEWVDQLRNDLIARAHGEPMLDFLLVAFTCAFATGLAAWLVSRFSPYASGSGIPHVEAVLEGELPPAPFQLIPVKFVGGVLAIGSGLALGREGPSVQMGASLADFVGKMFRRNWSDCRVLLAAGAGAGLATAFNAPIAGAVFVLEELVRRFEPRIAIAALGSSASAISVARLFLGNSPEFSVKALPYAGSESGVLFLVLGAVAGIAAVAYNSTLLWSMAATSRLSRWPVELRAVMIGCGVGILAWFWPSLVGGGDALTQSTLSNTESIGITALIFLLRFGLGAISYAARTPGGLFAPMLVLGTQLGLLFGALCRFTFPGLGLPAETFAIVGMAAFFTGVVRAPVTGIVLVIEMTASFNMLLPMLGACFTAMLIPTLLGNAPIYESLAEHVQSIETKEEGGRH